MVAITWAVNVVQEIELVTDVVTEGMPALADTTVVAKFVHPLAGLVTVNVYVLGEEAVAV